jgi:DNA-binding transcriptional regulator GbsR (MarR family)
MTLESQVTEELEQVREQVIQEISRMTRFWGFSEAMGMVYGAIYLSPVPLAMDELAAQLGLDQETVQREVALLQRLNMVWDATAAAEEPLRFQAETDFWQVARLLLKDRKQNEFALALRQVDEARQRVTAVSPTATPPDLAAFYQTRLQTMLTFFDSLESLITLLGSLDDLRLNALLRFFGNNRPNPKSQIPNPKSQIPNRKS